MVPTTIPTAFLPRSIRFSRIERISAESAASRVEAMKTRAIDFFISTFLLVAPWRTPSCVPRSHSCERRADQLQLLPQQRLQPIVTRPAHLELRSVRQHCHAAVLRVRFNLSHPLQVHNDGSMNTHESLGVK